MTPPPPDKIHQHHFWYMDLNKPYRTFEQEEKQKKAKKEQ